MRVVGLPHLMQTPTSSVPASVIMLHSPGQQCGRGYGHSASLHGRPSPAALAESILGALFSGFNASQSSYFWQGRHPLTLQAWQGILLSHRSTSRSNSFAVNCPFILSPPD
jgi:hypothetical protein